MFTGILLALYRPGPRKNALGCNGLAAFFSRLTIGWAVPYSPMERNALMGDSGARRVAHEEKKKPNANAFGFCRLKFQTGAGSVSSS